MLNQVNGRKTEESEEKEERPDGLEERPAKAGLEERFA